MTEISFSLMQMRVYFQCVPFSFDVDLHHDENVFLTILRTCILYSYVSEIYDRFHFGNAIPWSRTFLLFRKRMESAQRKKPPPGHSALRFGGPPLTE